MRTGKFFAFALGLGLVVAAGVDGQPPNGPKGFKGGFDKKGFKGQGGSERLIDDLNIADRQKTKAAHDILRAYDEKMRKIATKERQDMLVQMKEVLDPAEYKRFQEEVERVPLISTTPAGPRGVGADDLVSHLMSFDKNGDGKISLDELPERMRILMEQGDTNKDGVLHQEEIKRLAERSERAPGPRGPGGGPGPRPFPPAPPPPPRGPGN